MMIVKATGLRKEWNGRTLFENIDLEIASGEHVVLLGQNGVGKTTLLQGLIGQLQLDRGEIQRFLPLEKWGWLKQSVGREAEHSAIQFVQSGIPKMDLLKQKLDHLQRQLTVEGRDQEESIESYSRLLEQYEANDGYTWEAEVEKCLRQVQLDPSAWELPFHQLSGGQKTRVQLARLLLQNPSFILMDEPTNHLDSETLQWLEKWINAYKGAILLVTHDRYFMDQVAHAIYEMRADGSTRYSGGYTPYKEQKDRERRTLEVEHRKQEQERKALLENIRRYQQWFHQAHRAAGQNDFYRAKSKKNVSRMKAKESALERLEQQQVQKPREERRLNMRLQGTEFSAHTLVRLDQVRFAYSGEPLFEGLNLSVNRGDRIAVIGPNGTGKSTLLKLITGNLSPQEGSVYLHPQTAIGYFEQELSALRMEETILDSLLRLPDMTQTTARTILGSFLFSGEDAFKSIGDLSMGEKCRVAFLSLYFSRANLLVLDEPTNYLDINTREKVEEALAEYPGAMVLVSHDRYLIRRLANRLVILDGESVQLFSGTYEEYMESGAVRPLTTEEQHRENERRQLEWQLARLIGQELPDDADERARILTETRRIRQAIDQLK
ncbi:ABC-F type ribosomal protection protein [Brevibacillus humidisoli]|uniref:ribosomal protection-like ABC-F family protein n=1 Tax=Brevibacillus humidisoli TaxID=2895522 RepID=UPI001E5C439F|nr:ABC-F type ribosomal protection protein [Brevibacillus humidisoli]UFJ42579.1 ABC-F type ribosomal protection protein [Brevibacillus humidisoli]